MYTNTLTYMHSFILFLSDKKARYQIPIFWVHEDLRVWNLPPCLGESFLPFLIVLNLHASRKVEKYEIYED